MFLDLANYYISTAANYPMEMSQVTSREDFV